MSYSKDGHSSTDFLPRPAALVENQGHCWSRPEVSWIEFHTSPVTLR